MAKKRKRRRRIRWGRVSALIAVIALVVTASIVHPYDKIRRYVAQIQHESVTIPNDAILRHAMMVDSLFCRPRPRLAEYGADGAPVHNRVLSVSNYREAFPDSNSVQLATAKKLGIQPIKDRSQAEKMKKELVYIGDSPYYDLRTPMNFSIPYLIPRAERLLTEIARNFQDSLVSKGLPIHKIQVSSVLRTENDVRSLRRGNPNATDQSCHRFGTTFDLSYNYYTRVQDPQAPPAPEIGMVQMKSVLAEVLRDLRDQGACYVKYEYKRPCFHITCR